jgi:two-component system, chemotaxis family, CheB/CheR fusion protein
MLLYKLEQLEDYAAYLVVNPAEVQALYEEITIHVTSFFRDPEAFELLKTQVFPQIAQTKSAQSPIRIWVAGCSTGEEVYSIAMCLLEVLADRADRLPIQIFATDISDLAIDKARTGIYAENQMMNVSAERRRRFFNQLNGGSYRIGKTVRDLCVFACQNLGGDPPFYNLDLISCRNVLIYLGESLQQRIMPIFHYSLNETGFLFLGTAETTGKSSELFALVDKKYKIYAKNPLANRPKTFSFTPNTERARYERPPNPATPAAKLDLEQQIDRLIVARYAPIGVTIDSQMQVRQMRGDIDLYLKLASGSADLNIFTLVRPDLQIQLRAAIYQARQQDVPVTKQVLTTESSIIHLQVIPFTVPNTEERCFLVLFESVPILDNCPVDPASPQGDLQRENARLRQELDTATQAHTATQDYLQSIVREHECVDRDFKIANEKILLSNEQLQSINEELETTKEEIQATNEELNITNAELRSRNSELFLLNNDTLNFLASINIAIVMLTNDLRVRRFTPMAQRLFNLIPTDTQRHFSDLKTNLDIPDLKQAILAVQATLRVKALEVQTTSGQWYMLTIRPYRTTENQIDGIVLVLHDIHAFKRSLATLEEARNYAEEIVESVPMPLLVLESDLRVNKANRAFYRTFQVEWRDTIESSLFDLGNGQWNIPELRRLLEGILTDDTTVQNVAIEHQFERIGKKTMLLNAVKTIDSGDAHRILLSIEDITDRN